MLPSQQEKLYYTQIGTPKQTKNGRGRYLAAPPPLPLLREVRFQPKQYSPCYWNNCKNEHKSAPHDNQEEAPPPPPPVSIVRVRWAHDQPTKPPPCLTQVVAADDMCIIPFALHPFLGLDPGSLKLLGKTRKGLLNHTVQCSEHAQAPHRSYVRTHTGGARATVVSFISNCAATTPCRNTWRVG